MEQKNLLNFNLYEPDSDQLDEIVSFNYKGCDFIPDKKKDFKNYKTYVLTHPFFESIINGKSHHHVLGLILLTYIDQTFKDKHGNVYCLIYIEARCSFGQLPKFKDDIKAISDIAGYKINIGEILSLYVDKLAEKYKRAKKAKYCILYNYALSEAVHYHQKHGWRHNLQEPFKNIFSTKTGETALEYTIENGTYISHEDNMFKLV